MRFGINYSQGEILLVPFPFSNLSSIKKRPVVVLSKNNSFDIITCAITSNLKDVRNSLILDSSDLMMGWMPLQSLIKSDKIFTLEKSIILKKFGKLKKEKFNELRNKIYSLI